VLRMDEDLLQIISLENSERGHAKLSTLTRNMTIYLPTLTKLLLIPREYFPFNTISKLIEELTIHERLHEITRIREDYVIDSWHMLLCRLENGLDCGCPIDCFFRDCLAKRNYGDV